MCVCNYGFVCCTLNEIIITWLFYNMVSEKWTYSLQHSFRLPTAKNGQSGSSSLSNTAKHLGWGKKENTKSALCCIAKEKMPKGSWILLASQLMIGRSTRKLIKSLTNISRWKRTRELVLISKANFWENQQTVSSQKSAYYAILWVWGHERRINLRPPCSRD